jgi:Xaa-Pro aminopeptidase
VAEVEERAEIDAQLDRRRRAAAAGWDLNGELVLIGAGEPIGIPGRGDVTYPFRSHSEYYYLTDVNRPGGVLALDPADGWHDFRPPVTEAERLWSGAPIAAPAGLSMAELPDWLAARADRSIACLGVPVAGVGYDQELTERLRSELARVRRPKDAVELARMRIAAEAARAGFARAEEFLREGTTEREVQIELEAAAFRAEADGVAFDTIVGSGPNSGVLHVAPSRRRLRAGELVLIDAGPEHRGYSSDVTRTYAVGGRPTAALREIYDVVRAAQAAALELCRPGVEWREVHLAASLTVAEGLISIGLLRGQVETVVESGAAALFFPHGIGHLLGLGARDAGGKLPEREGNPPPFPNLRIDLPLEPGMVVTVEPGVYFVPALLHDDERRRVHHNEVAWDRVDRMLGFGGIRIEDDALITDTGHEVLTRKIPVHAL